VRQAQAGRVAGEPADGAVLQDRFENGLIFRRERRLLAEARRLGRIPGGRQVRRSRRALSSDNKGGSMLMDPSRNWVIAGERFDLSAEAVMAIVRERANRSSV
jgi:hypothetical protein